MMADQKVYQSAWVTIPTQVQFDGRYQAIHR